MKTGELKKRFEIGKVYRLLAVSFVLIAFVVGTSAFSDSIDSIKLLKISHRDESAVIKIADGRMQTIKVGDRLKVSEAESPELKVIEITEGRIVFEELTKNGNETVIVRLVDGRQRVERIRSKADGPVIYIPAAPEQNKGTVNRNSVIGR